MQNQGWTEKSRAERANQPQAPKLSRDALVTFLRESNRIEGILRDPTPEEIDATEEFLALSPLFIGDVERLVSVYEPGAVLRRQPGMNVYVGLHVAPRGGPEIVAELEALLFRSGLNPYRMHVAYEKLHPFTDGNGRSGRAIWLRHMRCDAPLGFLHTFYYQTLDAAE